MLAGIVVLTAAMKYDLNPSRQPPRNDNLLHHLTINFFRMPNLNFLNEFVQNQRCEGVNIQIVRDCYTELFSIGLIVNLLFQLRIQHRNFPLDFCLPGLVSGCKSYIACIGYQSGSAILNSTGGSWPP